MSVLEAKSFIDKAVTSYIKRKNLSPEEIIESIKDKVFVYMDDNQDIKASPRLGYVKSNIKGYYYIIHCDSCNARCRKVYPTKININDGAKLYLLCGKCAGKKYERRKEYEKKALDYLLHPEKLQYVNVNNLPLKECLAILEAGFIEEKIRERAYKNLSKYVGDD